MDNEDIILPDPIPTICHFSIFMPRLVSEKRLQQWGIKYKKKKDQVDAIRLVCTPIASIKIPAKKSRQLPGIHNIQNVIWAISPTDNALLTLYNFTARANKIVFLLGLDDRLITIFQYPQELYFFDVTRPLIQATPHERFTTHY